MSLDEWKECADWLERCGMLTDSQNSSLQSVEHLASILKDGVILCNLLNRLKPNTIPYKSYSIRPQGSLFLYGKNIRAFLTYCKSAFKMKDVQLFETTELLDFKKIGKVIFTLSNLSKTPEAKGMNIEPFSAEENTDYEIVEARMDEVESDYNSSVYGGASDDFDDNSEEIYDSLISSTCDAERACSVTKTKKDMCMEELVVTEKNFLKVLDSISQNFMNKLRTRMTEEEFETIFFMIDDIRKIHGEFYARLQAAFSSPQPATDIARCFLSSYMSMVVYGEFSSRMIMANQELERVCQQNQQVAAAVRKGTDRAKVKLHDLLTVPVQRILKYHLIIRELIKHCQGNEVVELKKALEAMEDLNLYINEVKRDNENINTIYEIQNSIVDLGKYFDYKASSLDSYGRRHFDGEYEIKKKKAGAKLVSISKGYVFVFDKIIILCIIKKKGEQYNYFASIAVRTLDIKYGPNEKELSMKNGGDEFLISCKKSENLVKLYSYLELAKDNCCPSTENIKDHHFILTNFKEATKCSMCHKLLRGKISQGYKCRKTSKIVHKECLGKIKGQMPERPRSPKPLPPLDLVTPPTPRPPEKTRKSKDVRKSDRPEDQPWWFSTATGKKASSMLANLPDGTFLVRFNKERGNYIITLKYHHIRHLVINENPKGKYFLKDPIFPDVKSLIDYYKKNSLQNLYTRIQSTLGQPYSEFVKGDPTTCRALCDFSPLDASHLGFKAGDIIEILSTNDEMWWRGQLKNKRGNFPRNYVEVVED